MSIKALTGLISDVVVPLPAEEVQKSSGLAFDIGSTIGKIIYRSNKEYKNGQPIKPQDDASKGQVHFAMFPRSDVQGMIEYIKENCDLKTNGVGKPLIYSSGVGGAAFQEDIEEGLNCKMDVIPEFDCFCKAFLALEKVLPSDELCIPPSPEQMAEDAEEKAKLEAMVEKMNTAQEATFSIGGDGEMVKNEDRPRLLVMAGSGTGIMQINNDGTFSVVDGLYMAGRFMYGLSAILTGENDFAKLEKMAVESDGKTVDTWLSDLKPMEGEGTDDNIYNMFDTDTLLFPFGKGVSVPAAEMKKGDLVRSVFTSTATIHVQLVLANIRLCKARSVYFCGNTFNTQIMRDIVTKMNRQTDVMIPENLKYDTHFLKNGGMYGAMGAYLHVKKEEQPPISPDMSIKPRTGLISDVVVPLPAKDVQKSSGLSLDIGSTIGKIIYRSNKEYKQGQPIKPQSDASIGRVHFAMFPRSDVHGMVEYIKENCDLKANEEGDILVFSSGVGGAAFQKDIEGGLNCKMDVIPEFDCFCKAFLALEKVLPRDELLLANQENAKDIEHKKNLEKMMKKANDMQEAGFDFGDASATVNDDERPRLLVMAGSGTGIMQINNDGTFSIVDGLHMAGRFMYGLASILTGENDFAKLEKMATESDGKTVDTWFSDLKGNKKNANTDNVYDALETDMHLFPFGKGVSVPASDMKKGDLVWSVFNATATIHVQLIVANAKLCKAKEVYFAGNTFNTQFMRDRVMHMKMQCDAMLPENVRFDALFLKNGGMYGAMGAYLHVKKQQAKQEPETTQF